MVSADEARIKSAAEESVGYRTKDEWNNLVDWWSHPDRVARSLQNAANRAKNTILTHQGKKSFAQGRNEYENALDAGKTGEFKTQKNLKRYVIGYEEHARSGIAGFNPVQVTYQISWIEVVSEYQPPEHVVNCQEVTGVDVSTSAARQPELPRFITNPHNNDTRSVDELARDKAGEDNDVEEDEQQTGGDEQQSGGDYSEDEEGDNEEVQDESEESD
ncbi:acidic leucine-rich nuclear phosphoprotein 32 family member A [Tanacetum coccineum]